MRNICFNYKLQVQSSIQFKLLDKKYQTYIAINYMYFVGFMVPFSWFKTVK